ncbi:transcriptional regulator [Boudabousia tangfeifanii]|uniref:Transcriptional regulator n=1 Tax=Boudabousia tangfeifanii TaxID=1912795 RepID=A0A1D9MIC0_9ACTO|nr:TfoX/Sxy family protein [Boudabousia tangfeifanii]AOZ72047.1 transcriptional regulator [Boudabousia tangfeifanii]
MASDESYLEYVLDLLSEVEQVSSRKMMGEYLLYTGGILFGGIYDNRFMLKDTPSARALLEQPVLESPYPGAKDMVVVDTDDPEQIAATIAAMLPELPKPKSRAKKR